MSGLSQSLTTLRGGKAKTGFWVNSQKHPVQGFGKTPLVKKPHTGSRFENHQGDRKLSGYESDCSANSRWKGHHGGSILNVLPSMMSLPSSSLIGQAGTLPQFLISGKAYLPIGFYLIWLRITSSSLSITLNHITLKLL